MVPMLPSADDPSRGQRTGLMQRLRGLRWNRPAPLRLKTVAVVIASVLGCQAMAASRLTRSPVAVLMPDGLQGAKQVFLQGLRLGEESVLACRADAPALDLHSLPGDADPASLFPRGTNGTPILPPLLVAPYAADLDTYGRLADAGDAQLILGHQRGSSLDRLQRLESRSRLWPLLPAHRDDWQALAEGTISRGWTRVLVVRDPSIDADRAIDFVTLFEELGGEVLSYTEQKVQLLTGDSPEHLARLDQDIAWLGPDALVVAADPDGDLVRQLRQRQEQDVAGRRLAWIWLLSAHRSRHLPVQDWTQLALDQPAQGPAWSSFADAFLRRWGTEPGLMAAAGFETARVLALTMAGPLPLASDGRRDPLGWLDPSAEPQELCGAIAQRRSGQATRLRGVASDFALRPGQAPSGTAKVRLVAAE